MSDSASQARAQIESICAMVAALSVDYDRLQEMKDKRETGQLADPKESEELNELETAAGECESEDDARQRIDEDPLSVEVRSDWATPGETLEPEEFCILLCTGGPAVRIRGELDRGEPSRAWVEHQDWGTPWTETGFKPGEHEAVLAYARCFYFGE